jgi:hypothetical protein
MERMEPPVWDGNLVEIGPQDATHSGVRLSIGRRIMVVSIAPRAPGGAPIAKSSFSS